MHILNMADINLTEEQKKEIEEKIGCAIQIQDAMQSIYKTIAVTLGRKDCTEISKHIIEILTPCATVLGNTLTFTHAIIQSQIEATAKKSTENVEDVEEEDKE